MESSWDRPISRFVRLKASENRFKSRKLMWKSHARCRVTGEFHSSTLYSPKLHLSAPRKFIKIKSRGAWKWLQFGIFPGTHTRPYSFLMFLGGTPDREHNNRRLDTPSIKDTEQFFIFAFGEVVGVNQARKGVDGVLTIHQVIELKTVNHLPIHHDRSENWFRRKRCVSAGDLIFDQSNICSTQHISDVDIWRVSSIYISCETILMEQANINLSSRHV